MAVEVKQKELHKHASSVAVIVVGAVFIIVFLFGAVSTNSLLTRVINIHPGPSGLGHIGSELDKSEPSLGGNVLQIGQDVSRSVILELSLKN